jgi:hypothetical protein
MMIVKLRRVDARKEELALDGISNASIFQDEPDSDRRGVVRPDREDEILSFRSVMLLTPPFVPPSGRWKDRLPVEMFQTAGSVRQGSRRWPSPRGCSGTRD